MRHNQFSREAKPLATKPTPNPHKATGFAERPADPQDTYLSPPLAPRAPKAGQRLLPAQGCPAEVKEELQRTSELPKAISRGL